MELGAEDLKENRKKNKGEQKESKRENFDGPMKIRLTNREIGAMEPS